MSAPHAYADPIVDAPRRNPLVAVLRSRSYLLLWTAQFASLLAGFFYYVAIAWLTLQITGSNLAVGSVLATAAVPLAVLMLLGGALSDRFSPRSTMLWAALARGLVMVVLALLAWTHVVQLWHLFLGAVLVGSTSAFFVPASTSLLPRLVAKDHLEAGNALLNISRTAAVVLGPAAAGVVVAATGAGSALGADAAASILAGLLVALLPAADRSTAMSTTNPLASARDGVRYVWTDIPLRATLLVIATLNFFALGPIQVGLPAIAYQRFSQSAVALGSTFAAWGLGSTLGSLVAAARPAPARFGWIVIGAVALVGAGVAAMGAAATLPLLLMVMVLVGVVEGAGTTYLISWMQRRTDQGMQGRVMSVAMLASVGLQPLALTMAGALASQHLGLLFWGSAAAIELTALAAFLSRAVRRL